MPSRLAITSMSLGRCYAGHSFTHKLDMAHKYGYQGLELFHEDLADVAIQLFSPSGTLPTEEPSPAAQLAAAHHIAQLCHARGISILCLQPFSQYDGLLDRAEHARRLDQLTTLWIPLARALGTDLIQIPANFLPASQVTTDLDLIVSDLQEVADIGLSCSPPIRFVYEALCWSTRVDTWEKSYEVVSLVDRPNFGLCLDTFNIAGRIFADPTSPSGIVSPQHTALETVRKSIARLLETVDLDKIFYVQVVDAERLSAPLLPGHPFYNPEQPARMSWSRNCRLFYGEKDHGAYLPVKEIAWAIFQGLGFEGWVSLELFNRRMGDTDPSVPEELARRGAVSWAKLVKDMHLTVDPPLQHPVRIAASL